MRTIIFPTEDSGKEYVITTGSWETLFVFEPENWQKYQECLAYLPVTNKDARIFRRRLVGNAVPLSVTEKGEVALPAHLWKSFAGDSKERKIRIYTPDEYMAIKGVGILMGEDYVKYVIAER